MAQLTATGPEPGVRAAAGAAARAWYRSKAPGRPTARYVLIATVSSVVGLGLLVAVGEWLGAVLLIPPMAASMALVAGASATPLAQPRNVVGSHVVAGLTGFLTLAVVGQGAWPAALAGGLAVGVTLLLRVGHSPAAASAAIVAATAPPFLTFLGVLALGSVLLVAVGVVGNRLNGQQYPVYWW